VRGLSVVPVPVIVQVVLIGQVSLSGAVPEESVPLVLVVVVPEESVPSVLVVVVLGVLVVVSCVGSFTQPKFVLLLGYTDPLAKVFQAFKSDASPHKFEGESPSEHPQGLWFIESNVRSEGEVFEHSNVFVHESVLHPKFSEVIACTFVFCIV
jgi:hypothetical protein